MLEPGQMLSHYRLVERIGEGGMGVVWKADDTKLGRPVALKVLPPEKVGDEERRLRFLREARTAAAVSHPNIAAVYEIDEAGGVIFIAMELVQGKTLRSLLGHGKLPLRDVLRIAAEGAEALASAHESKILHRDLKPENVMVRGDGHVKVLDFGLAKLREAPDPASDEATRMQTLSAEMTRQGRIFGTAAYMSPEQARGLPLDFRSDLFSFGVVLYEMATGTSPFQSSTATDTLSAIVRDRPRDAAEINPEVPVELGRILQKCLEKDPADRYQHSDELAVDLRKLRRVTDSQPITRLTDQLVVAPARRPGWLRPLPLAAAAVAVLALVAVALLVVRRGGPGPGSGETALAVMPFANLKQSDDPERFGQILQELIITDLSGLGSLTVFSSQRLLDVHKQVGGGARGIEPAAAAQVASRAGATTMLTGTLSQLGSQWILAGQLVDVASGKVLQSERIDGEDLYKMVDDLTAKIREDLLRGAEPAAADLAVSQRTTSSLEAYQRYLEGLDLLGTRDFQKAAETFQEALSLDPAFGQAQFKLAVALWWAGSEFLPGEAGEAGPADLLHGLLEGEFKLSGRERQLAEGMLAVIEDRFDDAERLLGALVQAYPDEKEAWYALGEARFHRPDAGRAAAAEAFGRALDLDPSFELAYNHLGNIYADQGDYAEAIEKVRGFLRHDPSSPRWYQEWIHFLLLEGDVKGVEKVLAEARDAIREEGARREFLVEVAGSFGTFGLHDRADRLLQEALEVGGDGGLENVLTERGWSYLNQQRYAEAERAFREALDREPRRFWALAGLHDVFDQQRNYAEAVAAARDAIRSDPEYLIHHVLLFGWALRQGDEEEAARALDEALRRASTASERNRMWNLVGLQYGSVDDVARAVEAFHEALDADPDGRNYQVPLALANGYLELRDYERALEWFGRAEALESMLQDDARDGRIQIHLARGEFDEATRLARRNIELQRSEVWRHVPLIRANLQAGREREAESVLESALASAHYETERRDLLHDVTWAYLAAGRPDRAEELARQALDNGPQRTWNWARLGDVLLRRRDFPGAEAAYRKGLSINPRDVWSLLGVARVDVARGSADAAERQVREILEDGPAHRDVFANLALALVEQGKFREAEPYARKVLAMRPDRWGHTLVAWVLIAGDLDLPGGLALAEKAAGLPEEWGDDAQAMPFDPSAEHCLGLAYLKARRYDEAVAMLEKATSERPDRPLIQDHLQQARQKAR